jgi:hypothetical protein
MDSNGDHEMSRASNEAGTDVDRPSDGGPVLGITLLFMALLALGLA